MEKEVLNQGKRGFTKKTIIIITGAIIIITFLLIYFYIFFYKTVEGELAKGNHVKEAFLESEGTIINISLEDFSHENVTKIIFIFVNQSNDKIYYTEEEIFGVSNYLINASDILESWHYLLVKKMIELNCKNN